LIFSGFLPLKETLVWATPGIAENTAQNFKMWQNFPQELFSTKKIVTFPLKKTPNLQHNIPFLVFG
jgi:hypothetical protein